MAECSRSALLRRIQQLSFVAQDLQLYLDTHPRDRVKLDEFRRYLCARRQAVSEYEKRYGALSYDGLREAARYNWTVTAWPWEKEG